MDSDPAVGRAERRQTGGWVNSIQEAVSTELSARCVFKVSPERKTEQNNPDPRLADTGSYRRQTVFEGLTLSGT